MKENQPEKLLEERIQSVLDWIQRNKQLIVSSDSVKIELNIKGTDLKGQIINFPS